MSSTELHINSLLARLNFEIEKIEVNILTFLNCFKTLFSSKTPHFEVQLELDRYKTAKTTLKSYFMLLFRK